MNGIRSFFAVLAAILASYFFKEAFHNEALQWAVYFTLVVFILLANDRKSN